MELHLGTCPLVCLLYILVSFAFLLSNGFTIIKNLFLIINNFTYFNFIYPSSYRVNECFEIDFVLFTY